MQIEYPEHPLEKMFYEPPLMNDFKRENAEQKNDNRTSTPAINGIMIVYNSNAKMCQLYNYENIIVWNLSKIHGRKIWRFITIYISTQLVF